MGKIKVLTVGSAYMELSMNTYRVPAPGETVEDDGGVAYIPGGGTDVGMDIFQRGLCLPSDIKMTEEELNRVIETVRKCFE